MSNNSSTANPITPTAEQFQKLLSDLINEFESSYPMINDYNRGLWLAQIAQRYSVKRSDLTRFWRGWHSKKTGYGKG